MARKGKKEPTKNEAKPISAFRFVAGIAGMVVLFFVLFAGIGMVTDGVKYTIEGLAVIDDLEASIINSEQYTKRITQDFEAESAKKLAFISSLYENDRELLEQADETYLTNALPFSVYDADGAVIVQTESFPYLSQGRIQNYLRAAADGEDVVTVDDENLYSRIQLKRLPGGETVMIWDDLAWQNYIAENLYDAKQLIESTMNRHSFMIAEKDGMYYAGPARYQIPEDTPMKDVLRITEAVADDPSGGKVAGGIFENKAYFIFGERLDTEAAITVYYMLDVQYVFKESVLSALAAFGAVIFAMIILLFYLIQYRRRQKTEDTPQAERGFQSKRRILLVLGVVLTALVAYYTRTMFCVSLYVMDDSQEIDAVRDMIADNEQIAEAAIACFHYNYEDEIQMVSRYLSLKPERIREDTLRQLSDTFGFEYLMAFDRDGNLTVTDSDYIGLSLSGPAGTTSNSLRRLLNGGWPITVEGENDLTGVNQVVAAGPLLDADEVPTGVIAAAISGQREAEIRESISVPAILDRKNESSPTDFYLISSDTKRFIHTPYGALDGLDPMDYGFTEETLKEDFSGRVNIVGVPYYMTQGNLEGDYIYTALPFSVVYGTRLPFTLASAAAAFLILQYASMRSRRLKIIHVGTAPSEEPLPPEEGEGYTDPPKITARHIGINEHGLPASPEEQTTTLILRMCQIVGVAAALILLFRDRVLSKNSMIIKVLDGGWQRGLNIYGVTAVMILILMTMIGVSIVIYVLKVLSRILSPRGETICRLLRSATEYISVILVTYIGFGFLGVRVEAIITTASVTALLVGMGAQDLTADIIAGLFLMFESEFKVGDIIDTGGKLGIVREIGIHSTKLIDFENNVLIISNSKLADIINRTERNSFAFAEFRVSSKVRIRDLEALFQTELPPLKTAYPKFIGEPYFRGVTELSGTTMKCSIAAEVTEKDRIPMERILNREVLQILKKAEIPPL